jgi:hypothetical protein
VLFFASPFFEAALSGNWSETGRPQSISSVITISQPPSDPAQNVAHETPPELTFAPIDSFDSEIEDLDVVTDTDSSKVKDDATASDPDAAKVINRVTSLAKLEGQTSPPPQDPPELLKSASEEILNKKIAPAKAKIARLPRNGPDAVIVLKEERVRLLLLLPGGPLAERLTGLHFPRLPKVCLPAVSTLQPKPNTHTHSYSLECTITWNNVEGLMNISHKLCVPPLQRECLTFLLTHAAGKPIKAMRIAELFQEEELYRESSRFVLDNPGGWSEHELNTLSQETLLKLEKRFVQQRLQYLRHYTNAVAPDEPGSSRGCSNSASPKSQKSTNAVQHAQTHRPVHVY